MEGGAGEDEQVPNGMVVRELSPRKEDDSEGVGESSGHEEPQAGGGDFLDDAGEDGDDEPAHDDVECGGGPMLAIAPHEGFGEDAANGEKPNDAKNAPAEGAAHGDQGEGGVGPGYQEVDRGVVEDLEELLDFVAGEAVVKG